MRYITAAGFFLDTVYAMRGDFHRCYYDLRQSSTNSVEKTVWYVYIVLH